MEVQNLPSEILSMILKKLERRDLCQAVAISRHWADVATDIIWNAPPARVRGPGPVDEDRWLLPLVDFVIPERRQFYVNKVARLQFEGYLNHNIHTELKHLNFPKLRSVKFQGLESGIPVRQYFTPFLQEVQVEYGQPGVDFLEQMRESSASIQILKFNFYTLDNIAGRSAHLLALLEASASLRHFEIGYCCTNLLTTEILGHLATRGGLDACRLPCGPRYHEIPSILSAFPSVSRLGISASSALIASLLPTSQSIRSLDLHFQDPEYTGIGPISQMTSLESLQISGSTFEESDLLPLSKLTALRRLRVEAADHQAVVFTPAQACSSVSSWPDMKELRLRAATGFNNEALLCLAKSSRRLHDCSLRGQFDLFALATSEDELVKTCVPLFPELEFLELSQLWDLGNWDDFDGADKIARFLDQTAPKLLKPWSENDNEATLCDKIYEVLSDLKDLHLDAGRLTEEEHGYTYRCLSCCTIETDSVDSLNI